MRKRNRSDLMLVEILIGVFFFMLSLTVLVQVFAKSRNLTVKAEVETKALAQAQNVIESIYNTEDPLKNLQEMGFLNSHGVWVQDLQSYSLMATMENVPAEAGTLWRGEIKAFYNLRDLEKDRQEAEMLFSLPCVWYRGV
ncbi:MAG: hypothetical protein IIY55_02840 [Blautia sp.]|nr:hypothetical protein [Blautia sp.]